MKACLGRQASERGCDLDLDFNSDNCIDCINFGCQNGFNCDTCKERECILNDYQDEKKGKGK